MHGTDKYSQHSSIIWPVWFGLMVKCSFTNLVVVGSNPLAVTYTQISRVTRARNSIQATIEYRFTLKRVRGMIIS